MLTQWLAEQIDNLAGLEDYQRHLMGDLPIEHPWPSCCAAHEAFPNGPSPED
ncbi:hypothetical protein ACFQV4_30700 [Streptomyces thermocarboxydus]